MLGQQVIAEQVRMQRRAVGPRVAQKVLLRQHGPRIGHLDALGCVADRLIREQLHVMADIQK